jgi:biopolymer transport protein ExbD
MTQSSRRPRPPEEVAFPVTPMLDMAFQLLAFFILTFQAPSRETRIDLDLPAAPLALPGSPQAATRKPALPPDELDLETDLVVRAEADGRGVLKALRLGEVSLPGAEALEDRLRRYAAVLEGRPLRVALVADDHLVYEEAARLVGACSSAGVTTIRLPEAAAPQGAAAAGQRP